VDLRTAATIAHPGWPVFTITPFLPTPVPTFEFIPRTYIHFDSPIPEDFAEQLATNPQSVARHSFYPFIGYNVTTQKIRKKPEGDVELMKPKKRLIAYAAHKDSHIFAHYSQILAERYEAELQERNLHNCVTAFRSLDRQRNIHFANEVFEFICAQGECAVLALDVSDFFGNLLHAGLKAAWCRLPNVDRLPDDHFAVFRAVTQYSQVDREALCKILGLDPAHPGRDHRSRFCSPRQFREVVRANGLVTVNHSRRGVPQGSPISAILSNIYLLAFDSELNAIVTEKSGIYRRYCDDLLVVLPTLELRAEVFNIIRARLEKFGLPIHPDKTEPTDFVRKDGRLFTAKPLNYLGFTFDGQHKRIRPGPIAPYYKKVRRGVGRANAIWFRLQKASGEKNWTPLRRRQLHLLYSYIGRHNFLSYAFDAARIMNDAGIKKQVKAHWKRLQQLITSTPEL
jgi:hypothetical protein